MLRGFQQFPLIFISILLSWLIAKTKAFYILSWGGGGVDLSVASHGREDFVEHSSTHLPKSQAIYRHFSRLNSSPFLNVSMRFAIQCGFWFGLDFGFCVSRQGFSVQLWLSWNLPYSSGWPRTQRSTCLCARPHPPQAVAIPRWFSFLMLTWWPLVGFQTWSLM